MKRDDVIALLLEAMPGLSVAADDAARLLRKATPRATRIATSRPGAVARLGERWISVEEPLYGDTHLDALGVLHRQSALPGGIKVVRRGESLGLRAEIPIGFDTVAARDWVRRQAAVVHTGLCAASARERGEDGGPDRSGSADNAGFDADLLAERCTAGGWRTSVARDAVSQDAEVRVDLASRSVHRVAVLRRCAGAIRVAVKLETGALAQLGPESQQAVAVLLMRATRSLRWVRAFADACGATPDAPGAVGFECLLASCNEDQPVAMALDALATACDLYGREAEALAENNLLARDYLALQPDTRDRHDDRRLGAAVTDPPLDSVSPDSMPKPGAVDLALV